MAQIQEGLRTLQQEAPEVFSNMLGATGTTSTPAGAASTTTPVVPAEGGSPATGGTTTTTPPNLGNVELATLMASLLNMAPGSAGAPVSWSCMTIHVVLVEKLRISTFHASWWRKDGRRDGNVAGLWVWRARIQFSIHVG